LTDRIRPADYAAFFNLRDSGDPRWPGARDRIVLANLGLAGKVAGTRVEKWGNRLDMDDMIQAGVMGLCRAADTFDPAKGVMFSTYAYWCTLNAITSEVCRFGGLVIRVPQSVHPLGHPFASIPDYLRRDMLAALAVGTGMGLGRDGDEEDGRDMLAAVAADDPGVTSRPPTSPPPRSSASRRRWTCSTPGAGPSSPGGTGSGATRRRTRRSGGSIRSRKNALARSISGPSRSSGRPGRDPRKGGDHGRGEEQARGPAG
jgi:RNA polymerase sigma factor (sigma-70 family)